MQSERRAGESNSDPAKDIPVYKTGPRTGEPPSTPSRVELSHFFQQHTMYSIFAILFSMDNIANML
jgi:hypothetical protein